jgi:predicted metal-binding protein
MSDYQILIDIIGGAIGSITQNGTTAVLYNVTSDQRLKTNVIDAPSASSIIDAIQIRSFDCMMSSKRPVLILESDHVCN